MPVPFLPSNLITCLLDYLIRHCQQKSGIKYQQISNISKNVISAVNQYWQISSHKSDQFLHWLPTTVFHENMFLTKKEWLNPLCKYLGVALKESKSFRGCTSHFCFDLFYIVDFHSALTLSGKVRVEWKFEVKPEMICAPPKTYRN